MKKYIFIFIFGVILSGVILSLDYSYSNKTNNLLALAPTPYPTISVSENYSVVESDTVSNQVSRNIEVISPLTNDRIKSGFVVKGNARVKNNTVVIRLSDSSGKILSETTAIANSSSSGNYGPFEKLVYFNSKDKSGILDVFQFNNIDGSINDVVSIPLNFN